MNEITLGQRKINLSPGDKVILGLDLSLNSMGYALVDLNSGELIEKGIVEQKLSHTHHQKLNNIYTKVASLVDEYSEYELLVAKESLLFSPPRAASVVAKVHGVIDLIFPDIKEYHPKTIKKDVAGNGNASKEDMTEAIIKHLGTTPEDTVFESDDEVDAIGVCLMLLEELRSQGTEE